MVFFRFSHISMALVTTSSFSVHLVIQNFFGNSSLYDTLIYVSLLAGESWKRFHIAFKILSNHQYMAWNAVLNAPYNTCIPQPPTFSSGGSSFPSRCRESRCSKSCPWLQLSKTLARIIDKKWESKSLIKPEQNSYTKSVRECPSAHYVALYSKIHQMIQWKRWFIYISKEHCIRMRCNARISLQSHYLKTCLPLSFLFFNKKEIKKKTSPLSKSMWFQHLEHWQRQQNPP